MKSVDSTKPKYTHLFKVVIIFLKNLHIYQMDFTFEAINEWMLDLIDHSEDGYF